MKSLSMEYEDFIRNREQSGKQQKHTEKNLEQYSLTSPTWIRDIFSER